MGPASKSAQGKEGKEVKIRARFKNEASMNRWQGVSVFYVKKKNVKKRKKT